MLTRSRVRVLAAIAVAAAAVFIALTIAVTVVPSIGLDSWAFRLASQLRAPWLDHAARVVTTLGLIAIVGPALVVGAFLIRRRHLDRACALLAGATLAWVGVWITKFAVDRPRPPAPLVHTTGQSYPSGHAANAVGWLALAIAIAVLIPSRSGRITALAVGAVITALVGLSRIYLRAHYASDVIAGEALAVTMYALAAIASLVWKARRPSVITRARTRFIGDADLQ